MTLVIEYSKTEQGLNELRTAYSGVIFEVNTTKGMELAKQARAQIRTLRTDLEAMRKEIKAPALERCRLIDAEAQRITMELRALENPIDDQIKIEESRKREEKEQKEREEQARIAIIQSKINEMKNYAIVALKLPSDGIELLIAELSSFIPSDEEFQELKQNCLYERDMVLAQLRQLCDNKKSEEAKEARLKELEQQMEEQRLLLEEKAKEQARIKKENEKHEAEQKAEIERLKQENERLLNENVEMLTEATLAEISQISCESDIKINEDDPQLQVVNEGVIEKIIKVGQIQKDVLEKNEIMGRFLAAFKPYLDSMLSDANLCVRQLSSECLTLQHDNVFKYEIEIITEALPKADK